MGPGHEPGPIGVFDSLSLGGGNRTHIVAMQTDEGNAFVDAVFLPFGFCEKLHRNGNADTKGTNHPQTKRKQKVRVESPPRRPLWLSPQVNLFGNLYYRV